MFQGSSAPGWRDARGARPRIAAPVRSPRLLVLALSLGACTPGTPPPPESRVETVVDTLHGVAIADDYRWLEGSAAPEIDGSSPLPPLSPAPGTLPARGARPVEIQRVPCVALFLRGLRDAVIETGNRDTAILVV